MCCVCDRDYKEYHTDTTVKFVVKMTPEKLAQAEQTGLHKIFKLQTNLSANMVSLLQLQVDPGSFCWVSKWLTFAFVLFPLFALWIQHLGTGLHWQYSRGCFGFGVCFMCVLVKGCIIWTICLSSCSYLCQSPPGKWLIWVGQKHVMVRHAVIAWTTCVTASKKCKSVEYPQNDVSECHWI